MATAGKTTKIAFFKGLKNIFVTFIGFKRIYFTFCFELKFPENMFTFAQYLGFLAFS
jgi:hypothetical protein